ncbi:MAG: hypothetical protein U5K56_15935 [Halioglobus sp.]|nr:hypothetical protein [Halioglobus sp.]
MTSEVEVEEQARLEACQASIRRALSAIDTRLGDYAGEIQTRKEYLWEARRDMDHIEKIAVRQTIEQSLDSAEVLKAQQQKLIKLLRSPYFGRFDFKRQGAADERAASTSECTISTTKPRTRRWSMTGARPSPPCSTTTRPARRATRRRRARSKAG